MSTLGDRLGRYLSAIRTELDDALREKHTPRQVAGSFALGVFITSLPTLGLGVLLFFVIVLLSTSISKIAIFASVLVLNPIVKWGVYGLSFWIGTLLLGPIEGISVSDLSLSATPDVVARLFLGNLILAAVFSIVAYVGAYRFVTRYRRQAPDAVDPSEAS